MCVLLLFFQIRITFLRKTKDALCHFLPHRHNKQPEMDSAVSSPNRFRSRRSSWMATCQLGIRSLNPHPTTLISPRFRWVSFWRKNACNLSLVLHGRHSSMSFLFWSVICRSRVVRQSQSFVLAQNKVFCPTPTHSKSHSNLTRSDYSVEPPSFWECVSVSCWMVKIIVKKCVSGIRMMWIKQYNYQVGAHKFVLGGALMEINQSQRPCRWKVKISEKKAPQMNIKDCI